MNFFCFCNAPWLLGIYQVEQWHHYPWLLVHGVDVSAPAIGPLASPANFTPIFMSWAYQWLHVRLAGDSNCHAWIRAELSSWRHNRSAINSGRVKTVQVSSSSNLPASRPMFCWDSLPEVEWPGHSMAAFTQGRSQFLSRASLERIAENRCVFVRGTCVIFSF